MSNGQHRRVSNTDADIVAEYESDPENISFETWARKNRAGMSRFRRERIKRMLTKPERGLIQCVGHAHRSQAAYDTCGARAARDAEVEEVTRLLEPGPWPVNYSSDGE